MSTALLIIGSIFLFVGFVGLVLVLVMAGEMRESDDFLMSGVFFIIFALSSYSGWYLIDLSKTL